MPQHQSNPPMDEIVIEALRKMYDEAEPSLDFDDVVENPDDYGDDFYQDHRLSHERQNEIVNTVANKYNLSQQERNALKLNAITYYGPRAE